MRSLLCLTCVVTLLAAPLSAGAQGAAEPAQSTEPTESRLERWHPQAFEDPKKPAAEPSLKLEVDSSALEVTPPAVPTLEELEQQKRGRRIGIAVGVSLVVVIAVSVAAAVSVSNVKRMELF